MFIEQPTLMEKGFEMANAASAAAVVTSFGLSYFKGCAANDMSAKVRTIG